MRLNFWSFHTTEFDKRLLNRRALIIRARENQRKNLKNLPSMKFLKTRFSGFKTVKKCVGGNFFEIFLRFSRGLLVKAPYLNYRLSNLVIWVLQKIWFQKNLICCVSIKQLIKQTQPFMVFTIRAIPLFSLPKLFLLCK